LQARSARATNAVAAGEAGIAGFTVDSLMQDIIAQEGRFNERTDTNLDWTVDQLQESKKGAQAQMRDRINS
ncbi:virion core protein, T7 gp14 family, partial [Stenotrophomonas maltophilia]